LKVKPRGQKTLSADLTYQASHSYHEELPTLTRCHWRLVIGPSGSFIWDEGEIRKFSEVQPTTTIPGLHESE